MSRIGAPSQSGHWSTTSPPPSSLAHASSSSTVECVGVTRSRTLLFISYRDSVPRGQAARRRQKPRDPFSVDQDPLGANSLFKQGAIAPRKGKGRDNGIVYFDFNDDAEDIEAHSEASKGYRDDGEEQESSALLAPDCPSADETAVSRRRFDHTVADIPALPPRWVDASDQIDLIITSLGPQIANLDRLQAKHLLPGFVDRSREEREIAKLQGEITREFRKCSKLVASLAQGLQVQTKHGTGGCGSLSKEEAMLARNVQTALAQRVQDASGLFRKKQSNYMQRLKGQDIRHREVMGELGLVSRSARKEYSSVEAQCEELAAREDMEMGRAHLAEHQNGGPQQQQQEQLLLMDSELQRNQVDIDVAQRHSEITRIASSIVELSQLFQDLQSLVIDQGSLVDRIDYNIETMGRDMVKANEELQVATRTQRKTGRGQCILFLILLCALSLTIIIVKPFWRFFASGNGGKVA